MRARVVPAVVALCLALTACSGDDDPPAATLPPTSTASATPTVTAFAVPSEATAATPDGAAEFVRFFYAQLEAAYAARDPELVKPLIQPGCETCQRIVEALTRLRDERATVENYRIHVVDAVAPRMDAGSRSTNVTTVLDFAEFVRRDAQGNETSRQPARDNAVQDVGLALVADDTWRVQSLISQ